jgi:hypothetical protein
LPNSKIHLQFTIAKQQDPPSIYDCQTARSTFNLRLPNSKIHLQFTIAKEHAGHKVRLQLDPRFETVMGLPSTTTIYVLQTRAYQ